MKFVQMSKRVLFSWRVNIFVIATITIVINLLGVPSTDRATIVTLGC